MTRPLRASASETAICDTAADHFLSIENYPETIRLSRSAEDATGKLTGILPVPTEKLSLDDTRCANEVSIDMNSAIARTAWPADQELAGAVQRATASDPKPVRFSTALKS